MTSSPSTNPKGPDEGAAPSVENAETTPTEADATETFSETAAETEACANCGAERHGMYCSVCGQRAANRIVPLWQVTNEFLEDLIDLDLRILNTFPTFFFRPGQLTVEYVRGRRRRYIRPLRLYLFSSFLLFTVLAFTNLNGFSLSFPSATAEAQADVEAARAKIDSLRAELAMNDDGAMPTGVPATTSDGSPTEAPSDAARSSVRTSTRAASVDEGMKRVDDVLAALSPVLGPPEVSAGSAPTVSTLGTEPSLSTGDRTLDAKLHRILRDPGQIIRDMMDRAPYLMFVLVPTFALLLKLLYLRRRRLYLEHLIFALHVHALAFITFAVSAVVGSLGVGATVSLDGWLAAAPFGYLFFAIRTVYGQSLGMVALKTCALLAAYGIILVAALVLLVIGTVALM